MFYAVLALLQGLEKIPSKHGGVIGLFGRKFYKTGIFPKQFSQDLHRAFELRQKSDYRDLVILTRDTAEEAFNKASIFVETVQKYLTSQGLSKYDNAKEDK